MFTAFLITLREGLEAALIVGIVLGVLRKLERRERNRVVWGGVFVAVVISVLVGLLLNVLGLAFEERGEQIFEGVAMWLAVGVLTWMIFWMQRQGRQVQAELERDVRQAAIGERSGLLFTLAFVAVVREGVETALFLTAAAFSTTPTQTLLGGILGLAVAVALGWLIFVAGRPLNLRTFFRITGLLLILFAAGLFSHGVHEFEEAGLLPPLIEHVWDINPLLDENSVVGSLLGALLGYNGNPSLLEVLSYISYFVVIILAARGQRASSRPAPAMPEP